MSWLVWTVLRWTLGYMCLFQFWFPWCVRQALGLLGKLKVHFVFWKTPFFWPGAITRDPVMLPEESIPRWFLQLFMKHHCSAGDTYLNFRSSFWDDNLFRLALKIAKWSVLTIVLFHRFLEYERSSWLRLKIGLGRYSPAVTILFTIICLLSISLHYVPASTF